MKHAMPWWGIAVLMAVVAISAVKYGGDKLHRPPDGWDETTILKTSVATSPGEMVRTFVRIEWAYFRPLGLASFWLDREISGRPTGDSTEELYAPDSAFQFRLTNIGWHILGALAFGWMLAILLASPLAGGVAAVLFAAAAANGFTALWFAARFDQISAVMIFVATGCFFRHLQTQGRKSKCWLASSVTAVALGLMAKENTLVLPVFLSAAALLLSGSQGWNWRKAIPALALVWIVAAAYLVLRHFVVKGFMDPATVEQIHEPRFWNSLAKMYFWPVTWLSSFFQSYAGLGVWVVLDSRLWKIAFLVVAASASIVMFRARWRQAVTLWVWVLVFYAPVACNFSLSAFQHYLALPKAGYSAMMAMAIACWIVWLYEHWPVWQRQIASHIASHSQLPRPAQTPSH